MGEAGVEPAKAVPDGLQPPSFDLLDTPPGGRSILGGAASPSIQRWLKNPPHMCGNPSIAGNVHDSARRGFASAADAYEESRPTYPDEAVAWLARELEVGPGRTVVDLAAGTGKLTRLLIPTGATVIAIEPVAEMHQPLEQATTAADA